MTDKIAQNPEAGTADALPLSETLRRTYGDELKTFELSEAQKREILLALWNLTQAFVDLGFSVGPTPKNTDGSSNEKLSPLTVDVLKLLGLEDTAHETVAPLVTHNEEEQP